MATRDDRVHDLEIVLVAAPDAVLSAFDSQLTADELLRLGTCDEVDLCPYGIVINDWLFL